ncbi:deoxyribose mutarotase [Salmonella enterica subsp. enterica]|uniref:Deoxyribose mutarotase n=1 Tax=Salmonella enterica I TaxID=59201 RepID=A0A3S4HUA7_SALET|nr:deoxyribose mutarotase [Salmonella enterica subsp. enterica]
MTVTNLASVAMPLQYMCHMNYAYVPNAHVPPEYPGYRAEATRVGAGACQTHGAVAGV